MRFLDRIRGNLALDGMLAIAGIEQNLLLVHNDTGGPLVKGDQVYISGYDATLNQYKVAKADADFAARAATLVILETIATDHSGKAAGEAIVSGLNTNAIGAAGDPVYLSATAGGWAVSAPTGADQLVQEVGTVIVKSATVGKIRFYPGKRIITAYGTSALQTSSVTSDKIAPGTIVMSDLAADVPRKYTVYCAGALAIGELLHITGYNAANGIFTVEKADADTSGKQAQLIASSVNAGATTSEARDILELTTLNTDAGNVGDPVYLDPTTAGGWTLTGPTGADQVQQIVGRISVKDVAAGKIYFDLAVGPEIVKMGSSGLQAASVLKTKLAGGFSKAEIIAGGVAGDLNVADIAVGDELVAVLRFDVGADTGTEASGDKISNVTDIKGECTIGAGKITTGSTNTTGDILLVLWNDLT